VIERAFILCKGGLIERKHLPENISGLSAEAATGAARSLREVEAQFLLAALRENKGNRAMTARKLGIHKSTLYRKLNALGLRPDR
jgi:transcriptional regulator of acetoin/glycerol metabolism